MTRTFLLLAITLISTSLFGQQLDSVDGPRNPDLTEIERLEAEWNRINEVSDADGKRLLLAGDSYHVGPSGRIYTRHQDIQAQMDSRAAKESSGSVVRFVVSDQRIRMFKDVAVVTATGRSVTTLADGTKRHGDPFRVVHVWEKRDGRWLLIVDQVTAVAR